MTILLTELTNNTGSIAKKYSIENGEVKKVAAPEVYSAVAEVKQIPIDKVSEYLNNLGSQTSKCIVLGVPGKPGSKFDVVVDSKVSGEKISRSGRFFKYANSDSVSLMYLDFDGDHDQETRDNFLLELDILLQDALIGEHGHERKRIMKWIRPSSSSSVKINGKTGNGLHVFLPVKNASSELIAAVHRYCWTSHKSHQGHLVTAVGSVLSRSLIDAMVGPPERIVFTSDVVADGEVFETVERSCQFIEGGILDCEQAISLLNEAAPDFDRKWSAYKANIEESQEVRQLRKEAKDRLIQKRIEQGMTDREAKKAAKAIFDMTLLSNEALTRNNGDKILVREVLENPDEFLNQSRFCDPVKLELNRNVGKIMGEDTAPFLHSMSHGGVNFRFKWTFEDLKDWTENASQDELDDWFGIHMANLEGTEGQTESIMKIAAGKSGITVVALRKDVKEAKKTADVKEEKAVKRSILDENATHIEMSTDYIFKVGECHSYGNSLYVWKDGGTIWDQMTEDRLVKEIGQAYMHVLKCGRASDYRAIKGLVLADSDIKIDRWIQAPGIPCSDGFWAVGEKAVEKLEYTKDMGCRFKLGYKPDFATTTPLFDRVVRNVENPELFQQLFGLTLSGYLYKIQKVFTMFGEGGTGKGTTEDVLMAMLPSKRIRAISLEKLNDPVFVMRLADCHVNIISEVSDARVADLTGLKKISGGGMAEGRALYNNPEDFYPTCSFVLSMNKFIPLTSTGNEIVRRFADTIVRFNKQNLEVVNGLAEKIIEHELPGILAWAIEGINNYLRDGLYTDVSRRVFEDWTTMVDTVKSFCVECVTFGSYSVLRSEVWQKYKEYCDDNSYKPTNKGEFFTKILKMLPAGEVVRKLDGVKIVGLRLK